MFVVLKEATVKVSVKQLVLTRLQLEKEAINKRPIISQIRSELFVQNVEPFVLKPEPTPTPTPNPKVHSRFKTEKCRHFYEFGTCAYGDRCVFAHGQHELNQVVIRPPNYKTRVCTTYQFDGYCTFGTRCAFVHKHYDPIELLESTIAKQPRLPMPENLGPNPRPEFYPSDILIRKTVVMDEDCHLLPSSFSGDSYKRLSTFKRITGS